MTVRLRPILAAVFTVAGLVLIAIAALHYARAARGQSEGREAFVHPDPWGTPPVS